MKRSIITVFLVAAIALTQQPALTQPNQQALTCKTVIRRGKSYCWCWVDNKPYRAPGAFCQ